MNFILENLILDKNPYFMDFDLETSRVYTENKGKNQLWLDPIKHYFQKALERHNICLGGRFAEKKRRMRRVIWSSFSILFIWSTTPLLFWVQFLAAYTNEDEKAICRFFVLWTFPPGRNLLLHLFFFFHFNQIF